jgi:hypothetical protein
MESVHGCSWLCTKSDSLSGDFVQVAILHKKWELAIVKIQDEMKRKDDLTRE